MKKRHRNIFIFFVVSMITTVAIVALWLHAQKTPSKTIDQDLLVFEFLGRNIFSETVDYSQFYNSSTGADFCLVLDSVPCESFIKTIDYCYVENENFDSEYMYGYYQSKFSFLDDYMYNDCSDCVYMLCECEYAKGHSFFETTYVVHHPIYIFSFQKGEIQKLIVCSSLPYFLK